MWNYAIKAYLEDSVIHVLLFQVFQTENTNILNTEATGAACTPSNPGYFVILLFCDSVC